MEVLLSKGSTLVDSESAASADVTHHKAVVHVSEVVDSVSPIDNAERPSAEMKHVEEVVEAEDPVDDPVSSPLDGDSSTDVPTDGTYELEGEDTGSSYDDINSSYDDDSLGGDDTCTLASYITKYRFENGRRYHAYRDGAYWAPNDDVQNDQQDIAHHLWLLTLDNKLFLAPLVNPQRILDVGTGTGIWAIDMADRYPSAAVTGTDLSPIQPHWVPPNCNFEVDDVTLHWTYRSSSFDFIHVREMFGSVSDWAALYAEAFRALKPGGYLEHVEHSVCPVSDDATVGPDHVYSLYGRLLADMGHRNGKRFDTWKHVRAGMVAAGFVEVVETRSKWPMNGWCADQKMKEVGRWNQLRVEQGIEGFALRTFTTVGGWSYTEVQALTGRIRSALKDKTVHGYLDVTVVYGRKPLDA